jgi:hypothetical protein
MPWRYTGEWRHSSTIHALCTRWSWVVIFTLLPLYPRGQSPGYPVDRRLVGPQNLSGHCGEEKIFPFRESKPGRPTRIPSLFRTFLFYDNIVTRRGDYRRGLDWCLDLFTIYTHDPELQAVTARPLISTIHKSPQHPLIIFQLAVSSPAVP